MEMKEIETKNKSKSHSIRMDNIEINFGVFCGTKSFFFINLLCPKIISKNRIFNKYLPEALVHDGLHHHSQLEHWSILRQ